MRWLIDALLCCSCLLAEAALAGERAIVFEDATASSELAKRLVGIMNHAAACGDVDGDGSLDLYIGNFCDRPAALYKGADGPVPNILLLNKGGRFVDSGQAAVALKGRTSGSLLVDLDNDGDPDLYTTNNSVRGIFIPNKLFENVGGRFRDVSEGNAACIQMGGRSASAVDFDGDGLLDLLVCEDVPGRTRIFRNKGKLQFEDVTAKAGIPDRLPGLGVITPDLNLDGYPDVFVTPANRLLLSRGDGTYREATEAGSVLRYKPPEGDPCGVAFADVDRDGDMDIAIADHSKKPGARQHLFLNLGLKGGVPEFREVSKEVGLDYIFPNQNAQGILIKSAHIEFGDFDNDGWPDLFVAATYDEGGRDLPFVARNLGRGPDGLVRFLPPPVARVNAYFPSGPVGDYDRDGRLDIVLPSWFPEIPSRLFLNRSQGNHWLEVQVVGKRINRSGIGARVKLYPAGKLGDDRSLLGCQEIATGQGFCSGQEPVAHFGLGPATRCDIQVTLPFGKGTLTRKDVSADQRLVMTDEAATQ
ncbi:MAG: CRTAC1 family protein [Planctomycetes bacterium]|nr:CRTAC1 family protein [Planctomycetota bacterium]